MNVITNLYIIGLPEDGEQLSPYYFIHHDYNFQKRGYADATYRSLSSWKLSMTRGRAKVSSY